MNASQVWIIAVIAVLLIVAVLVFFVRRKRQAKRLTPLASLAFAFVIAGIAFGDSRLVGYGLMGIGVILAVVDVFRSKQGQMDNASEKQMAGLSTNPAGKSLRETHERKKDKK